MSAQRYYLFFLAFLAGAGAMTGLLSGTRLLAPFFGASLVVWSAALAVGLAGLTIGHFLGSWLCQHLAKAQKTLYWILLLAGALLFLMPYTSKWIAQWSLDMELITGIVFSLLGALLPILLLIGISPPVFIDLLTVEAGQAGRSAGALFAVYAFGGILMTILLGFLVIPDFGVSRPAMILGALLMVFPAFSLVRQGFPWGLGLFFGLLIFAFARQPYEEIDPFYEKIYQTESMRGLIEVFTFPAPGEGERLLRGLFLNRILQTVIDPQDLSYNFQPYTAFISKAVKEEKAGRRALLLGMGGGHLARQLDSLNLELDVVTYDRRLRKVAARYFGFRPAQRIVTDDARHFLQRNERAYDLIVYDVLKGETASGYLLTHEAWEMIGDQLRPDGLVALHLYSGEAPVNAHLTGAILHSMKQAGFTYTVYFLKDTNAPESRVVLARKGAPGTPDLRLSEWPGTSYQVVEERFSPSAAPLLTDERPHSLLFARAAMEWRRRSQEVLGD